MEGKTLKISRQKFFSLHVQLIALFLVDVWIGEAAAISAISHILLFLDSEAGEVGITRGELESGGVIARKAHRRLGTDVCHGVVFLSYRHVYEHLLVHYDGITRLDGTTGGRNGS